VLFIDLVAKYISKFHLVYAGNNLLFIKMPGDFARELVKKVKVTPEVVTELNMMKESSDK
jgi:hypothetical protein